MDLIKFFTSFEKLMKERLVVAFYWLALIVVVMTFISVAFDTIKLGPLAFLIEILRYPVLLLLAIVSLRLICEAAIALFRINDNLSPDGGKSETADIDPIEEARKAAEEAAKRAREATSNVVNRTRAAAETTGDALTDAADSVEDVAEDAVEAVKETTKKATAKAKSTARKASTTAKKTASSVRLKKDGTPAKKPGPKPKS